MTCLKNIKSSTTAGTMSSGRKSRAANAKTLTSCRMILIRTNNQAAANTKTLAFGRMLLSRTNNHAIMQQMPKHWLLCRWHPIGPTVMQRMAKTWHLDRWYSIGTNAKYRLLEIQLQKTPFKKARFANISFITY